MSMKCWATGDWPMMGISRCRSGEGLGDGEIPVGALLAADVAGERGGGETILHGAADQRAGLGSGGVLLDGDGEAELEDALVAHGVAVFEAVTGGDGGVEGRGVEALEEVGALGADVGEIAVALLEGFLDEVVLLDDGGIDGGIVEIEMLCAGLDLLLEPARHEAVGGEDERCLEGRIRRGCGGCWRIRRA